MSYLEVKRDLPCGTKVSATVEINGGTSPRQRILDAAFALVVESGLNGMPMRDVALRANVSTRTLYQYFPTKSLLLLTAVVEKAESEDFVPEARFATADPVTRVVEAFRPMTEVLFALPQMATGLMASLAGSDERAIPLMRAYRTALQNRALDAMGVQDPTPRESTVVGILTHVWFSSLSAWSAGVEGPDSVLKAVEEAAKLLLDGP